MIPVLSTDLIKQLDEQYPHQVVKAQYSIADVMYYAGMRKVITELLERQAADDKDNSTDRMILPNRGN